MHLQRRILAMLFCSPLLACDDEPARDPGDVAAQATPREVEVEEAVVAPCTGSLSQTKVTLDWVDVDLAQVTHSAGSTLTLRAVNKTELPLVVTLSIDVEGSGSTETSHELETFPIASGAERLVERELDALLTNKAHPASRVLLPQLQVFTPEMKQVERTIAKPLYFHHEGDLIVTYGAEIMREEFARGTVDQALSAELADKLDSVRRVHVWAP